MNLLGLVLAILLNGSIGLAWEFLPRDNTSQVDMYNFLLCLTHVGFGNDTNVYTNVGTHYVTLHINGSNAEQLNTNAGRCNRGFGEDLTFSIISTLDSARHQLAGTISEMLDSYLEMPDWSRGFPLSPLSPYQYSQLQVARRNERIRLGLDVL